MAIIYTYPRLTDPDGTELIVVSETKNQNATRLMTINDIVTLVGSLVPGGGTVTSIKLDFSSNGIDTGLRLWSGAAFTDHDQTITTAGSFEVGGTLVATNGGTGHFGYAVGDILYADTTTTLAKLVAGTDTHVLTLAAGVPTWAAPTTGTMSSWVLAGDNVTTQTITDGGVVGVLGGTDITTTVTAVNKVTVTHDAISHTQTPRGPTVLAHGGNFTAINSITVSAQGHVTATDLETYTLPAAGGTTGQGFSPLPVGLSDLTVNMDNVYYYLTVAEDTMTLANFKVWGQSASTGDVELAIYRYGWGTGALIGRGTIGGAGYGPNVGTLAAEGGQNLDVTVGEDLIVALRRSSGTWDTVGDNGANNAMFGQSTTPGTNPFPALTPTVGGGEGVSDRFALTLY